MTEMPIVKPELCNGCGLCVSVCQCRALVLVDDVITIIESQECAYCTECEAVCPTMAISCPYEIIVEDF